MIDRTEGSRPAMTANDPETLLDDSGYELLAEFVAKARRRT
jgi:hypothetical protein